MKQFVDRQQEMETLQSEYERNGSALVVLYGRRRVGKTTLISEFIRDKNALFFLASEESEAQNRAAFKEKAAEFIDSDLLRNADVKSWDVIFALDGSHLSPTARQSHLVKIRVWLRPFSTKRPDNCWAHIWSVRK